MLFLERLTSILYLLLCESKWCTTFRAATFWFNEEHAF